jgi:hypothetical protein
MDQNCIEMKFTVKTKTCILVSLLIVSCSHHESNSYRIPFSDALDRAAIVQDSLNDILENSLLLGNGDLNGLVNVADGKLIIRLSKNDVGD